MKLTPSPDEVLHRQRCRCTCTCTLYHETKIVITIQATAVSSTNLFGTSHEGQRTGSTGAGDNSRGGYGRNGHGAASRIHTTVDVTGYWQCRRHLSIRSCYRSRYCWRDVGRNSYQHWHWSRDYRLFCLCCCSRGNLRRRFRRCLESFSLGFVNHYHPWCRSCTVRDWTLTRCMMRTCRVWSLQG